MTIHTDEESIVTKEASMRWGLSVDHNNLVHLPSTGSSLTSFRPWAGHGSGNSYLWALTTKGCPRRHRQRDALYNLTAASVATDSPSPPLPGSALCLMVQSTRCVNLQVPQISLGECFTWLAGRLEIALHRINAEIDGDSRHVNAYCIMATTSDEWLVDPLDNCLLHTHITRRN